METTHLVNTYLREAKIATEDEEYQRALLFCSYGLRLEPKHS